METIYNKLVRDNIPEIIRNSGGIPFVRVLGDDEFLAALNAKLSEEVAEYLESGAVSELCDILEVVYAIAETKGSLDLELGRREKSVANGGFEKKLFLEKVVQNRNLEGI